MRLASIALLVLLACPTPAQRSYVSRVDALRERGMAELGAFSLLKELTTDVGPRLSGSVGADKAVQWGKATMERLGFQNVRLIACKVPVWIRGAESLEMLERGQPVPLSACALGMSVSTPDTGITAEIIEVRSLDELKRIGNRAQGKIVFFNGPMKPGLISTFAAYGDAGPQRFDGAAAAAKVGAVAVVVRSLTLAEDDVPHTGTLSYEPEVNRIPGAAVSIVAANRLHERLQKGTVTVRLTLKCKTLPDADSANVVGEIVGSEKPDEVIVMGGHLDSWDKGTGAHDDGAGVCQSLDALRLIKDLGWRPKRTIRVVLFMNEENGSRGAAAYAQWVKTRKEKAIAAIESDAGGFAPRGFSCSLSVTKVKKLSPWLSALSTFEAEKMSGGGGGGADVGPLQAQGAVLFGLQPESQRYFDYHHSDKDTLDKVNPRELQLGSLSMAMLAWLIADEGISP